MVCRAKVITLCYDPGSVWLGSVYHVTTAGYVCMYVRIVITFSARGQVNGENNIPLSPCVPENLVSRDGFSRPVASACSSPYSG